MHGTQRPWQSVSIKEIHSESGLPRPCWVDGPGRCCWRQRGHGVILRPAAEERSRPSPVGESGAVENRDRDVDRADVSPSSAASPVRSFDTCRVRSNYWVTCSRSVTPELSPLLASVPSLLGSKPVVMTSVLTITRLLLSVSKRWIWSAIGTLADPSSSSLGTPTISTPTTCPHAARRSQTTRVAPKPTSIFQTSMTNAKRLANLQPTVFFFPKCRAR